jgi:hypothetical protein
MIETFIKSHGADGDWHRDNERFGVDTITNLNRQVEETGTRVHVEDEGLSLLELESAILSCWHLGIYVGLYYRWWYFGDFSSLRKYKPVNFSKETVLAGLEDCRCGLF